MDCKHCLPLLADYLEQALTARRRRQVEQHLGGCPACRAEIATLQRTSDLLAEAVPAAFAPPADLWERVAGELDRAPQPAPRRWRRWVWAGSAVAAGLLVVLWLRPPGEDMTAPVNGPMLRDHYVAVAHAPLGSSSLGDLLQVDAEERR